jgi:hypothetical protein
MQIQTLGNFVIVDIHKPFNKQDSLDYDFCRVRKDYFDRAKKSGRFVLVRTPNGERVFSPKAMKEFKVVKEAFLFPDRPMSMYELAIPHGVKKNEDYYKFG